MDAHTNPHPFDLLLDWIGLPIEPAEPLESGEGGEVDPWQDEGSPVG